MNLTALQHSPFLQSLGWAIANSLWQAAALWIAYVLINGIYKGASAKFKNNLSTVLLLSGFVWFCITLFTKYFAAENLSAAYQVEYYNVTTSANAFSWNAILNKVAAILPYLSIAYLLLLVFLSLRLINVYRFTRFVKLHGLQKPAVEWKLFTDKVARHMGITRKIKLWVSRHVDVPATIGFVKPVILIPLASVNQLSADQLEAIILHELSHIKRNDYLINLFISIVETILFFNPFIVLLAKVIKRERENCCDDFVIQYQYDRHAYASALLSLEQFRNTNLKLAIGATSGKKQLLLRVKRIMEINSNTNFNYGQKLAALFLITGLICSIAWLSPQNHESKKQQVAKKQQDKIYQIKTESNSKFESLVFTPMDNKLKTVPVKQIKKELTRAELQLKELKALNLKSIAERESNRLNMLLMESKKAIFEKNLEKFNNSRNRLFLSRTGGETSAGTTFFVDNGMTIAPFNELAMQQGYAAELQKYQEQLNKAQFSFSFDFNMPDVKELNKEALNQKQLIKLQKLMKDAVSEKLIKIERSNADAKFFRHVPQAVVTTSPATAGRTYVIIDSTAVEVYSTSQSRQPHGASGRSITTTVYTENKAAKEPSSSTMYYSYGYNTNTANGDEKKVLAKVYRRPTAVGGNVAPVNTEAPEVWCRVIPKKDDSPAKVFMPRTTPPARENNIRVENRNGIIYINGKLVELPETNELLAQVTYKAKKITSKIKNINIDIND